jgi:hypothetical protein
VITYRGGKGSINGRAGNDVVNAGSNTTRDRSTRIASGESVVSEP